MLDISTVDKQDPIKIEEQAQPQLSWWGHVLQIIKGSVLVAVGITGYVTLNRWRNRTPDPIESNLNHDQSNSLVPSDKVNSMQTGSLYSPMLQLQPIQTDKPSLNLRYRRASSTKVIGEQENLLVDDQPLTQTNIHDYRPVGELFSSSVLSNGSYLYPLSLVKFNAQEFILVVTQGNLVYGLKFNNNGTLVDEPLLLIEAFRFPMFSLVNQADNKLAMTFLNQNSTTHQADIYVKFYTSGQTVNDQLIQKFTEPAILSLNEGKSVVTWMESDGLDITSLRLMGQKYTADGNKLDTPFQFAISDYYPQPHRSPISLGNDNFVLARVATTGDIKLQFFAGDGSALDEPLQISDSSHRGNRVIYFVSTHRLSQSEFIVLWANTLPIGNPSPHLYGQRYANNGTKLGDSFLITEQLYQAGMEQVAGLDNGGYVIAYPLAYEPSRAFNIYAQKYKANGEKLGEALQLIYNDGGYYELRSLTALGNGGFAFTWYTDNTAISQSYEINNIPILWRNSLNLAPGEKINLNAQHINATDAENDQLTYTLSNIKRGQFELVSTPGIAITSFNQTQLDSGQVHFIHDSSLYPPSYNITVADNQLTTEPVPALIEFDLRMSLVKNSLTIRQGATITLNADQLLASVNADSYADLVFIANDVSHGRFKLINLPNRNITQFSQKRLSDGQVQFEHDGSNEAPTYSISLSNGIIATVASNATVTFSLQQSNTEDKNRRHKLKMGLGIGIPLATIGLFGTALGGAAAITACRRHKKQTAHYTLMPEQHLTTDYYELEDVDSSAASYYKPPTIILSSADVDHDSTYDYRPS